MPTLLPRTVKGKLLFVFVVVVSLFAGTGFLVLSQVNQLESAAQKFFSHYAQIEDLIIDTRFLVDEISNTVLLPPDELNRERFIKESKQKLLAAADQFGTMQLPDHFEKKIVAALHRYSELISRPIELYRYPVKMMKMADASAELCLRQAEKAGRTDIVKAVAQIIDAYTDMLLSNDPGERRTFNQMVRVVESSRFYAEIPSFPQLKNRAESVFKANAEFTGAVEAFRQASHRLSADLASVDQIFHRQLLMPQQLALTTEMKNVSQLMVFALLVSIALVTLLSLFLGRKIWRPLENIGDMVTQLADGQLNHRLAIAGDDEFGTIGRSLNRFADQLKENLEKLDIQMAEMILVETELRKSEEYNRHLSEEYQVVLDGISEALTVIDRDRNVVWSNRKASEEFFSEIDRKVAQGNYQIDDKSSYYLGSEQVELCFQASETVEELVQPGIGKYFRVKVFPLKDALGNTVRVLKVINDVSVQYQLREEAEQSNRLASLGELSAGVAHEINNPNSIVLVNTPVVRDVFNDALPILEGYYAGAGELRLGGLNFPRLKKELPAMMNEMYESAQRIQRIVDDLKNFVRQGGEEQFEKIDLNLPVEAAIRLTRNMVKKATHHFSAELGKRLPLIKGNTIQIEQVVVNLIQNACLALMDRAQGLAIRTALNDEGTHVKLVVRDEGVGIPAEVIKRITDPFFTTRRQHGGTGLGLSVSKRIVEDHDGKLVIDSQPGKWTEVTVLFPVERAGG